MSDILDCIIKALADNGVSVEQTDIWKDNGLVRNVKSIIELDFSEHDKVFEDRIAELEKEVVNYKQAFEDKCKDYDFTSELLNKFGADNESLKQRIAELESENEQLKHDIDKMATSKSKWIDRAVEWQQKCEKLESKETETCEKKPKISDSAPSIEWYENRHQSDCIEINRLNTAIDVLIHKAEYLRQFAGLE